MPPNTELSFHLWDGGVRLFKVLDSLPHALIIVLPHFYQTGIFVLHV